VTDVIRQRELSRSSWSTPASTRRPTAPALPTWRTIGSASSLASADEREVEGVREVGTRATAGSVRRRRSRPATGRGADRRAYGELSRQPGVGLNAPKVGDGVVDLETQPGGEDVVDRATGEALDDAFVLANERTDIELCEADPRGGGTLAGRVHPPRLASGRTDRHRPAACITVVSYIAALIVQARPRPGAGGSQRALGGRLPSRGCGFPRRRVGRPYPSSMAGAADAASNRRGLVPSGAGVRGTGAAGDQPTLGLESCAGASACTGPPVTTPERAVASFRRSGCPLSLTEMIPASMGLALPRAR
jgi:hypothetical protein